MCAYAHTHVQSCDYVCIRAHVCTCVCSCVCAPCAHMCIHASAHTCIYTHVYVCTRVNTCLCMCEHMCIHARVCAHTYARVPIYVCEPVPERGLLSVNPDEGGPSGACSVAPQCICATSEQEVGLEGPVCSQPLPGGVVVEPRGARPVGVEVWGRLGLLGKLTGAS